MDAGQPALTKDRRANRFAFALAGAFLICFFTSFLLGRYPIAPWDLLRIVASRIFPLERTWPSQMETVLFRVRLPRVVAAAAIGAGLSVAGAAFQGVFRNPLASPERLGASAGAGFGAALALLCSAGALAVTAFSFAGGLVAVALVMFITSRVRSSSLLILVLAGVVVQALFTEGISFVKLVADPSNQLPAITYWLMGSLASIAPRDLLFLLPAVAAGAVPLFFLRWRLSALALGDDVARTIGVDARRLRMAAIACSTLITAACVAVSGMIGWVGLAIPHFARMLVGADYRRLLPACALAGASFLLIADNIARLATTAEIPIGILTAFVGAPFFLYLLIKEGRRL